MIVIVLLGIFTYFAFYNKEYLKNPKRIKVLRKRAVTDPIAKKRLEKIKRKHKRNKKSDGPNKITAFALVLILFLIVLFICFIPGWTDYIKKDYVFYEGDFSVEHSWSYKYSINATITLDDGTELVGTLGLEEGEYTGKIVYSKRTEIALTVEK